MAKEPKTVALQVRLPESVYELLKEAAERDNRSLSSWVRDRLQRLAAREVKP